MNTKKFIYLVIISVVVIIFIPAIIVFIIDPIQLYHNQITLKKVQYFKEQRHQNIGLVNNYLQHGEGNYTIILGTSMSENFVPSKFMKILHDKHVLKLTMSGGRPLEQYTLLKKVLETGKVKRVIWDIHWYYLLKKISQKDKNHDFPYKLYSDDLFEQGYYYLFNEDYVKDSIQVFTGKVNKSKWTENLNKLNYTMDGWLKHDLFKKNSSSKNIIKMNNEIKLIKDNISVNYNLKINYPDVDKYILPILKQYNNVEFNLFFPPYSTYFYAKSKKSVRERYIYGKKYLVDKTKNLKNIKIFGFDNNYEIVNNIYNYKDYGHYRVNINDYIMKSILSNQHIINEKNINKYIADMIKNINTYKKIYYKDLSLNNMKVLLNLQLNKLKWKSDGVVSLENSKIIFSAKNIKNFAYLSSKIKSLNNIDLVSLYIKYKYSNIKMFSISLKDGKEYAHYFIKPSKEMNLILLKNDNISKKSKNFHLDRVTEIVIRVYPKNSTKIKKLTINSIKFYKKENIK